MTLTCPSESVAQSRTARAQRPALVSVGVPIGRGFGQIRRLNRRPC